MSCLWIHSSQINFHLSLFPGEWEISAFDGSLLGRGMSIQYTVRACDSGDQQVDRDGYEDDISDYIDQIDQQPRGRRPQNHTALVRVCKKLTDNNTQSVNTSSQTVGELRCRLRKVAATSQGGGNMVSEGDIPEDVLVGIERDGNGTEPGEKIGHRQRRQAEENSTDTSAEIKHREGNKIPSEHNKTKEELEDSNDILLSSKKLLTVEAVISEEKDENVSQNHIQSERERLTTGTSLDLALEYDDYSLEVLFFFLPF